MDSLKRRRATLETSRRRWIILELRCTEPWLQKQGVCDIIQEERANPYHDPETGRFTSGGGGKKGKTKYAPSPQVNKSKIKIGPKTYGKLCGAFRSMYPQAKPEDGVLRFAFGGYQYEAIAAENGGISVQSRFKLKSRR